MKRSSIIAEIQRTTKERERWGMIARLDVTLVLVISMFAAAPPHSAYAAAAEEKLPEPSQSDAEFKKQIEDLRDSTKSMAEMLKVARGKWRNDYVGRCVAAFGHEGFCQCLTEKGPQLVGFEIYIEAVTKTMAEMDFDNLPKRAQNIVMLAKTARNHCVQQVQ